jgi:anti-sigma regulatory factor (Ser/Thr protein kinase)/DNA-binding transcriptional ArsR family regulator
MKRDETVSEVIRKLLVAQTYVTSSEVATAAHVTRQAAHYHLSRMTESGLLTQEGARRSSRYRLNAQRSARYAIEGLAEHEVWGMEKRALREIAPNALENPAVVNVLNFAFTEMVNNAIDHSHGTNIDVRWFVAAGRIAFEIEDDGIGAFASLRESRRLKNDFQAVGELSKGKQTTDPDRHSGLGIFLTSRMVERFVLAANGYVWTVDNKIGDYAIGQLPHPRRGTLVRCEVPLNTQVNLNEVMRLVSDPVTHRLNRTSLRVDLFNEGGFVSRTEAKLIAARLEGFEVVELDFAGVSEIGQGFADELFRVWHQEHPEIRLVPVHANHAIAAMIAAVQQ